MSDEIAQRLRNAELEARQKFERAFEAAFEQACADESIRPSDVNRVVAEQVLPEARDYVDIRLMCMSEPEARRERDRRFLGLGTTRGAVMTVGVLLAYEFGFCLGCKDGNTQ